MASAVADPQLLTRLVRTAVRASHPHTSWSPGPRLQAVSPTCPSAQAPCPCGLSAAQRDGSRASSRPQVVACLAMSKPDLDFAVIGGGPAGLVMAKALMNALPGRSVQVFEAAAGYRPQGAGVLIEVNGWRALHAIDDELAEKMRTRGILSSGGRFYDEQGKKLPFQLPFDNDAYLKTHGHNRVMVHWGDIREILYDALPQGTVKLSTRVVGITAGEPGGEPAELTLQDASNKEGPTSTVRAGLVVAADGYFSRTKRQVFGGGTPIFRDKIIWRALMRYDNVAEVPALLNEMGDESLWYMPPGLQTPPRTALVYPVGNNRFVWTCTARVEDLEAAGHTWVNSRGDHDLGIQQTGVTGAGPKERCLAVYGKHPFELVDLITRTDPEAITEHGYYSHDFSSMQGEADWVRGNVVTIGDAAHTGPPDGMGLNMALEDVAVLGAELQAAGGATKQALSSWAAARLPRVMGVWGEGHLVLKPQRTATVQAASFKPLGPKDSGKSVPPPAPQAVVGVASA